MKGKALTVLCLGAVVGAVGGVSIRFALTATPQLEDQGAEKSVSEEHSAAPPSGEDGAPPLEEPRSNSKRSKPRQEKKSDQSAYFKFGRQFVAPVIENGRPKAMVILDVMIELSPGAGDSVYADEPRLRDAVLRGLLAQGANGDLAAIFSEPSLLEAARAAVLKEVRGVIGNDAKSILLMDLGYQPY